MEGDDEYIGECLRTFGERFELHMKAPFNTTGHTTTLENFSIVGRNDQNLMRLIKEAVYIRVYNLSLNRNISKYHLPSHMG